MQKVSILKRSIAIGLATLLALGTVASVPVAANNGTAPALQIPVMGTTSSGGTFQGTATITGFAADGNRVVAMGTISGIVNGQSIVSTFSAPVGLPSTTAAAPTTSAAQPAQACQVLNLVLAPLNLNVLGLVISIPNPIVLNISAVPAAGNLLGNLVCQAANLLNGGGAVQQVANLLNQILGILNGL